MVTGFCAVVWFLWLVTWDFESRNFAFQGPNQPITGMKWIQCRHCDKHTSINKKTKKNKRGAGHVLTNCLSYAACLLIFRWKGLGLDWPESVLLSWIIRVLFRNLWHLSRVRTALFVQSTEKTHTCKGGHMLTPHRKAPAEIWIGNQVYCNEVLTSAPLCHPSLIICEIKQDASRACVAMWN